MGACCTATPPAANGFVPVVCWVRWPVGIDADEDATEAGEADTEALGAVNAGEVGVVVGSEIEYKVDEVDGALDRDPKGL